jgi:5'-3' exonuclease
MPDNQSMQKHLLIDLGHLSYRMLFSNAPHIKEHGFGILRHALLRYGALYFLQEFQPTSVYIGVDSSDSWRKEKVSTYKAQRKELRDKHDIDWQGFYSFMNEFVAELKQNFPFYVIKLPQLEADDILAHIARILPASDQKILVTSDTDYIQLLKYENTKMYDPMKHKFIKKLYLNYNVKMMKKL